MVDNSTDRYQNVRGFTFDNREVDWDSEDRDYYLQLKERVDARLAKIRSEVREARHTHATGGEASDYSWLRRAEDAVRHMGRASQAIQRRLGDFAREKKERNAELHAQGEGPKFSTWAEEFVRIAAALLPHDEFVRMRDAAKRKCVEKIEEEVT